MVLGAAGCGGEITIGEDARVTKVGRWLRRTKIDELPQLFNVFKGDMSLVGPRPEVPRYVEMFREDYAEILKVRPGITDLASLIYRDESRILGMAADPEEAYVRQILPAKIRLAKEYVGRASFYSDFVLIVQTVFRVSLPGGNGIKAQAHEPRLKKALVSAETIP
jgi:lipopolysaccharide/colanic/teichoic acid biosynthesis glycosyltransferase